jgi:hypothetical protein
MFDIILKLFRLNLIPYFAQFGKTIELPASKRNGSVADPDPGSGAFLTPGSWISDPGSQTHILRAY